MIHPQKFIIALTLIATCTFAANAQQPQKCPLGRDYFLYLPKKIDADKTYWLVAGIHGFRGQGNGAAGYNKWTTQRDNVIVVGPSFPKSGGFTHAEEQSAEQLLGIHKQLAEKYKLHDKIFVAGFSGGSQFAHRFTMLHPDRVIGCAAHSGGSWATGGQWKSVNPKAAHIPIAMSCGQKDTDKMHPQAPMGRLDWAKAFEKQIADAGFTYRVEYVPDTGHRMSPIAMQLSNECFEIATGARGSGGGDADKALHAIRRQAERGSVANALRLADQYRKKQAANPPAPKLPDGWKLGEALKENFASSDPADTALTEALAPAVKRGLDIVEKTIQRNAPNRDELLGRIRKMYAGLPEVEQAIDAALDIKNE